MQFNYVAYDDDLGVVNGRLEAGDPGQARAEVALLGYRPLRVTPVRRLPVPRELFPSLFNVGTGELVRFSRQMATMLSSGHTLMNSLEILRSQTRNSVMRGTLDDVCRTLDEGSDISAALSRHPEVFNPLYISVVEAGEFTGRLAPALDQIADILEKANEAKQRAIRTIMYPAAIVGLSMVTLGVLITVALPPLIESFELMGTGLPAATKVALSIFGGITNNYLSIFIGMIAAAVIFLGLQRLPQFRYGMDATFARLPLVGPIVLATELSRFSNTVGMLLNSEVALTKGLQLGISGCKNQLVRRALLDAEESLITGHGMAVALKRHPILPPMFVQMVAIGEDSNSMGKAMSESATNYEKELERRLNTLMSILEPASTIFVGAIVAFIAFSMFVPIYSGLQAFE